MMQSYTLLKLFGLVLLTQVVLVAISFAEVFVYSMLVNPGQDPGAYDAHAMASAPWISGIFGFIAFFFTARYWTRKGLPNAFSLAWLFPVVYVVWDLLVVIMFGVPDWVAFLPIFLSANVAKALGSLGGYFLSK